MPNFKPMLAPNQETNLDEIQYPILASYKLDGIRCLFIKGEMLSRSLKPIVNKQLREKFADLIKYSKIHNLILDGEIYSPDLTFQEITSFVMTQDFEDKKSIKKHGKVLTIPEHLKFYAFDYVKDNNFDEPFMKRGLGVDSLGVFGNIVEVVSHTFMPCREDIEAHFKRALDEGHEGLILRKKNGRYKCGRGTIKEGLIYKVKPFVTVDAKIKEVLQGTKVKDGVEKTVNELGRSVTSKKKDDREFTDMVADFIVPYENTTVKVSCSRMPHDQRKEVWANKQSYIGKTIEYKFLRIGLKDKPRSPNWIRFREDKDETKK